MTGTATTLPEGIAWSGSVPSALGSGSSLLFDNAAGPLSATGVTPGHGNFSLVLWVRWTSSGDTVLLAQDGDTDSSWSFGLGLSMSGHLQFAAGASTPLDYEWSPSAETWYHLAVTRTGDAWKLYLDGSEVDASTTAVSLPPLSSPLRLGSADLAGNLDEVRFFNVGLSAGQVGRQKGTFI
jgi:hypothetical protein